MSDLENLCIFFVTHVEFIVIFFYFFPVTVK